jgi:hypothetical protein
MRRAPPAQLNTLNVVLVEIDPDLKLKVGLVKYDADTLDRLRRAHRDTHVLRRDTKADRIQSIAIAPGAVLLGDTCDEHVAEDVPWLVAPLIMQALQRFFQFHHRQILSFRPLRVIGRHHDHDLFPSGHGLPTWLQKRLSFVFETRILRLQPSATTLTLACDLRTKHLITATCAELLDHGIPLNDMYVGVADPNRDPELAFKPKLVGRVREVRGSKLLLDDHLDGVDAVEAADAYLESRIENIEWCVQRLRPREAERLLSAANASAEALRQGPTRLAALARAFDGLREQAIEYMPGASIRLGQMLSQKDRKRFPIAQVLEKPWLVFDPGGGRTGKWNQGGLDDHGPYDQRYFTPKRLRIALICQASAQGRTEQHFNKFFDGLPDIMTGAPQLLTGTDPPALSLMEPQSARA